MAVRLSSIALRHPRRFVDASPLVGAFSGSQPTDCSSGFAAKAATYYEHLPQGLVLADENLATVYANRQFRRLTGKTAAALASMTLPEVAALLFSGQSPARLVALMADTGRWHTPEHPLAGPSGEPVFVRVLFENVRTPDGHVLTQILAEDVTRYRTTIDALRRRQTLYRSLVERRADLMCRFLPDLSLLFANAAFCHILGVSRRTVVGKSLLSLLSLENGRAVFDAAASLGPDQTAVEVEQLLGYVDERPHYVRWTIQGFFYRTGHLKDCQAVGVDISEQKIAEDSFIHASRLVSLGTLVSGVAHEINNPNQAIALNARLCQDLWQVLAPVVTAAADPVGTLPAHAAASAPATGRVGPTLADALADMPALLADMADCSDRIADIVSELKEFSSHDDGSGFSLVSVNDVVRSAVRLMRSTIKKSTRRFSLRLSREAPRVFGRRQRLEQVLVNLLENACQALASPDAPIVVETGFDFGFDTVAVRVRDAGTGIAPADFKRVTEPFFTTRRGQGGTGLGLSISHKIVREHGGHLELSQNPEGGVTASVILPLVPPGAEVGP
jgi:two-component system, NtrC family, sensor histidine kinase HupT/HoxJ